MKRLSKKEQLALLDKPNAVQIMQDYVARGGDFLFASHRKILNSSPESFVTILSYTDEICDDQLEIFNNLTFEDAKEIMFNVGHIYPETWNKMLDIFPKDLAKELLLKYAENCHIWEETFTKIFGTYSKEEAKEIIIAEGSMHSALLEKILKIYPLEEVKSILAQIAKCDVGFDENTQLMIMDIFDNKDAKELLSIGIENTSGLEEFALIKIFVVFDKDDLKDLLMLCAKNDVYLSKEILELVIAKFSKEEAREIIETFFKGNCGSNFFGDADKERIFSLLAKKK